MINTINPISSNSVNSFDSVETKQTQKTQNIPQAQCEAIPHANSQNAPSLPEPRINASSPQALERLLTALNLEDRKLNCETSIAQIESKAVEQKELIQKKNEEIDSQLKKIKKQGILSKFLKAFKIIGAILGAVASAVTVAIGAMTANPLLIAGGALGCALAIDSTLSLASDGKISLSKGLEELGKKMGLDEEKAQKFSLIFQTVLSAATLGVGLGAGFSKAVSAVADVANKMSQALLKTSKIVDIAQNVNSAIEGTLGVVSTITNTQITKSEATQKDIEATLEKIKQSINFNTEQLKEELERISSLYNKVTEIVDQKTETQKAILGSTPTFA